MSGEELGTISLLGERIVMESWTGDSTTTPWTLGEDSAGDDSEGDAEEEVELLPELTVVKEFELKEEEEEEDEEEESGSLLPFSGVPPRVEVPSGPVVSK